MKDRRNLKRGGSIANYVNIEKFFKKLKSLNILEIILVQIMSEIFSLVTTYINNSLKNL